MNTLSEFGSEFPSGSCPCGCRGNRELHEAFESGLTGEVGRQRHVPRRPPPRVGGARPATPRPRPRPGRRGPGRVYVREPYPVAYPFEPEPGPGPSEEPGAEYNRWVRDCLNRVFGLSLGTSTGMLDAASRSAIRRLQKQESLPITGIVSPGTEQALRRLCGEGDAPAGQEWEGEWGESEWESEISRSSPDYIRWVQASLNKILGLRLAVNGVMGAPTRSAIRSFQKRQGLRVDGVVGAQTDHALMAARASPPPGTAAPAPAKGAPTPSIVVEPVPSMADYVDLAREILRKRLDSKQGIVLSVVQLSSADSEDLIDRRTDQGKSGRPYLKNPPAHVVMPPEVYEIEWKPKGRGKKPWKIQFVWILSNEKSAFPVGGILFLTTVQINSFYLATFNVGALDDKRCTNVHHAEMQATRFIEEQPKTWRSRVGTIDVWNLSRKTGLGYSPCNACCVDLAQFLTNLRALRPPSRASITWLTRYDKNKACGHPTDTANLRRLASSGWALNGPGWSPGQPLPSATPPRVWTA